MDLSLSLKDTGECPTLKIVSYITAASPPTEKAKIMLSISNPVLWAKLKSDGGFQYSGTKIGSVIPKSDVQKLTINISLLLPLFPKE